MAERPIVVARSLSPGAIGKVLAAAGLAGGLVFLGAPYGKRRAPSAPVAPAPAPATLRPEDTVLGRLVSHKREEALTWDDRIEAAARAAEQAWPGFHPLAQPALFSYPERVKGSFIVGPARAPKGFLNAGGKSYRPFGVPLAKEADPGFMWEGTRMTAIRIDRPKSPETVTSLFIRTAFHDAESRGLFAGEEPFYHLGEAEDVVLAALETRRLAAWAKDGDQEALRDFLAVRARRRSEFGRDGAEETLERTEGAARFLDVRAVDAVFGPARAREYLSSALRSYADPRDSGRLRPQLVGAALWRLLEESEPGICAREAPRGSSPSPLALARFEMSRGEASRRVAALTGGPSFARAVAVATRQKERFERFREGLRFAFEAQPGRRVMLTAGGDELSCQAGARVWFPDGSAIIAGVRECSLSRPGLTLKLSRSRLRVRPGVVEFFAAADTAFTVDGAPWRSRRGRTPFRRLTAKAKDLELSAESGVLESDGTNAAVSVAREASP